MTGSHHRVNAVVSVFHRSELSLQKNLLSFLNRLSQEKRGITKVRTNLLSLLLQLGKNSVIIQSLLSVETLKQRIFNFQNLL